MGRSSLSVSAIGTRNEGTRAMRKLFVLIVLTLFGFAFAISGWGAAFTFSTGLPDGRMATASQPSGSSVVEIESADDFDLSSQTTITNATFYGLLPTPTSVSYVGVEIYRVFPQDSTSPPSSNVPTRTNSPADIAFDSRSSTAANLTFSTSQLGSLTVQNTIAAGGIHKVPNQTTGGNGVASGNEYRFDVTFTTPIVLPAGHYFFVPQVTLSAGNFLWLSAPKPIVAPGTPFAPDLQSWVRDANLTPDWLRVGTDIVGGAPAPTFNAAFSLSGTAATVIAVTPATITAQEGVTFSGSVASFTDSDSSQTSAANFTATIAWGDGTSSAGTITSGATFGVAGTHTYADEGSFTVTITVTDSANQTGSATGTANVGEADALSGTPLTINATEFALFSGAVANFSDTYTGNPPSDFVATIDWGDGNTTAGTVSGGAGAFVVSGSHTYFSAGTFPVSVTLTDDAPGTATATVTSRATVASAPMRQAPTLRGLALLALAIALGACGSLSLGYRVATRKSRKAP